MLTQDMTGCCKPSAKSDLFVFVHLWFNTDNERALVSAGNQKELLMKLSLVAQSTISMLQQHGGVIVSFLLNSFFHNISKKAKGGKW